MGVYLFSTIFHGAEMAASRALNDQFRMLFEAAPNGVIAFDAAGCIALVNAQVEKMFGYSREELIGRAAEVLVPMRFRRRHDGLRKKFVATPQMRPMGTGRDFIGERKDGSTFAVEIGLNTTATIMGDIVIATIVDVTVRKRAAATGVPSSDLVQRLFALAPAEARVATLIGSGLSPRQAAKNLGISEETVRTTLKRVFTKVGVSRQSELAVLLTKLTLR